MPAGAWLSDDGTPSGADSHAAAPQTLVFIGVALEKVRQSCVCILSVGLNMCRVLINETSLNCDAWLCCMTDSRMKVLLHRNSLWCLQADISRTLDACLLTPEEAEPGGFEAAYSAADDAPWS